MKKFIIGTFIGGAIAGVTALLTAPKKGSELRNDAQEKFELVKGKTQKTLDKLKEIKQNNSSQKVENITIQSKDEAKKEA